MNFNFIAEAQVRLNRFMCLNLVSLQDKKAKQTAMQTVKYKVYCQNICFHVQCYGKTEDGLVAIFTRYRRRRGHAKSRDAYIQPESGAMGDAVMEDIPLNVTVSDIRLVGVSSDHSIASHHMTIESWLNKKLHGYEQFIHKI